MTNSRIKNTYISPNMGYNSRLYREKSVSLQFLALWAMGQGFGFFPVVDAPFQYYRKNYTN